MSSIEPPCEHIGFESSVVVARITETDGGPVSAYSAEVKIRCAMCHESFVFVGVPMGMSPRQPGASVDGAEVRLPIRPASAPDGWGEDGPGFGVSILGPEARRRPAEPGVDMSDPGSHGLLG